MERTQHFHRLLRFPAPAVCPRPPHASERNASLPINALLVSGRREKKALGAVEAPRRGLIFGGLCQDGSPRLPEGLCNGNSRFLSGRTERKARTTIRWDLWFPHLTAWCAVRYGAPQSVVGNVQFPDIHRLPSHRPNTSAPADNRAKV